MCREAIYSRYRMFEEKYGYKYNRKGSSGCRLSNGGLEYYMSHDPRSCCLHRIWDQEWVIGSDIISISIAIFISQLEVASLDKF